MKRVLIADDHVQIIKVLRQYAVKEGYDVTAVYDGKEAIEQFHKQPFDIVLLDVMMPEKDGFMVCKEIRRESMVPIIMITAKGEDYDRIMGLDMGADDYIVKPFSPSEVMARIRAILRRMNRQEQSYQDIFTKGNLTINLDKYQILVDGKDIALTKKEVEILWLLATNEERVFSRNQILDQVWGFDYFGDVRTVDTHIKRLRAKLEQYNHENWQVKTVRGVGYKFEVCHEKNQ